MSNNVYICQFGLDRVQQYSIQASIKDSGLTYQDIKDVLEIREESDSEDILEKKRKYHPIALELCDTNHFSRQSKIVPDKLWVQDQKVKLPTEEDHVFSIWNGGIVFNQTCVNILRQHRLGENILTPVQIYDLSTGNLVSDETYYFLNLYERREYICEIQTTPRLEPIPNQQYGIRIVKSVFNNGELNIDKSALNCDIDLWYDPRFLGHFFMSENLHNSLSQAGMIDKFCPYTCNLI